MNSLKTFLLYLIFVNKGDNYKDVTFEEENKDAKKGKIDEEKGQIQSVLRFIARNLQRLPALVEKGVFKILSPTQRRGGSGKKMDDEKVAKKSFVLYTSSVLECNKQRELISNFEWQKVQEKSDENSASNEELSDIFGAILQNFGMATGKDIGIEGINSSQKKSDSESNEKAEKHTPDEKQKGQTEPWYDLMKFLLDICADMEDASPKKFLEIRCWIRYPWKVLLKKIHQTNDKIYFSIYNIVCAPEQITNIGNDQNQVFSKRALKELCLDTKHLVEMDQLKSIILSEGCKAVLGKSDDIKL